MIDNDFHPVDQGLDATDDHWGTVYNKPVAANDNNSPPPSAMHKIWQNAPKLSNKLGQSK